MIFNPSRDQVRRFFIDAWNKRRQALPQTAIEIMATDVVALHPEYHGLLEQGEAALEREWTPEQGETNPFMHLSLHLAIAEQLSIDQPPGIRAVHSALLARLGEPHLAAHEILECLAQALWQAQQQQRAPDPEAYLDCLRRRA